MAPLPILVLAGPRLASHPKWSPPTPGQQLKMRVGWGVNLGRRQKGQKMGLADHASPRRSKLGLSR